MFQNWLQPVVSDTFLHALTDEQKAGHHLLIHTKKKGIPNLSGVQVAFIGTDPISAGSFRKYFYNLSFPFSQLKVADLGDLRKQNIDFCIGALAEIRNAGILPIVIGDKIHSVQALFRAMKMNYESINLVAIDEKIPIDPSEKDQKNAYLNPLLFGTSPAIFQLGLVGYQTHFMGPAIRQYLQDQTFDLVRLGDARTQLSDVEPVIRDADLAGLNLNALRASEASGVYDPSPSGFTVEEACRLTRYAGMSDKLKGFYLLGYHASADKNAMTAFAMAEMIWYFLDGFYHRKGDYPISTDGLTEYIVELKKYDYQLTFWKSNNSGRWWIQVPVKIRRRDERHRLIPCSYNDYRAACQDDLPDRLIKAFKRFA